MSSLCAEYLHHNCLNIPKLESLIGKPQKVLLSHLLFICVVTSYFSNTFGILIHSSALTVCHMASCTCKYPPGQVQFNTVFEHQVSRSMKKKNKCKMNQICNTHIPSTNLSQDDGLRTPLAMAGRGIQIVILVHLFRE